MFVKGLAQGAIVLIAAILMMLIARLSHSQAFLEITTNITVIVGWLVAGYFYKKLHGSIFNSLVFSENRKEYGNNLIHYIMGVGLIWGPVKLFLADFPISDVLPIFNLALLLLSIPMAGMSVLGALIIGGLFCADKS